MLEERFRLNTVKVFLTPGTMKYWNKLQKVTLKFLLLAAFKIEYTHFCQEH